MEIPVPNDWDGESYKCVQIEWPDSAQWFAILTGLLTTVARGYTWRVFTKEENDAIKAIGLEIVGRNLPYVPCVTCDDDGPDTPGGIQDGPDFSGGFGYSCDEMEDEMPGITWLEWENGQLYMYFGPCCKVLVDGDAVPADSVPDDSPIADPPTEPPTYACRRAWYMAQTLIDVADKVIDCSDDLIPTPTCITQAFAGRITFHWGYLLNAMSLQDPVDVANNWQESDQAYYVQLLACQWESILSNSADSLTELQFNAMRSTTLAAFPGTNLGPFLNQCLLAIGRGDISNAGLEGVLDDSVDCTCPPAGGSVEIGDIIWSGNVEVTREDGTYNLVRRFNGGLTAEHTFVTTSGSFKALTINHELDIAPGAAIDDLLLCFEAVTPSGELLHTQWHTENCEHIDGDSLHGNISNTDRLSQTITPSGNKVFLNEVWSVSKTSLTWGSGEARSCPQSQPAPKTYRWYAHIARVNGTPTGVVAIPEGV